MKQEIKAEGAAYLPVEFSYGPQFRSGKTKLKPRDSFVFSTPAKRIRQLWTVRFYYYYFFKKQTKNIAKDSYVKPFTRMLR